MNRDEQRDIDGIDREVITVRETEITVTPTTEDTAEIRAGIEQTRTELSETIDAIQERLNPTALKEQAQEQFQEVKEHVKEQVREQFQEAKEVVREATIGRVEHMVQSAGDTVNDVRYGMVETIRQNPIPAALVGIGLGWLFMNRRSASTPVRYSGRGGVRGDQGSYDRERPYYERPYYEGQRSYSYNQPNYQDQRNSGGMMEQGQRAVGNTIDRAQETASNVAGAVTDRASNVAGAVTDRASNIASNVSDTASNLVDQAQETASQLADRAQYQAQRAEDTFERSLRENPLAVGAIALALGTAVGLAVPQTERENQLMGEARDNLVGRAQEVASDTMEKVQRVASEVTDEAKQTVKEQAREQGLTA